MEEEIYKWLESTGWTKSDSGYLKKSPVQRGRMIINGREVDTPPEYIDFRIEYYSDGYIENSDGSNHIDNTQWKLTISNQESSKSTYFIVDSLFQFQEMLKELGL